MNLIKKVINNPVDSIIFIITYSGLRKLITDKLYLKFLWWLHYRKRLNLKSSEKFTEKLQWLKLYDRNPIYTSMVDKYSVKDIVRDKIGEEYIIPTLGIWDKPELINWQSLPDKFVLKTTHGGGNKGVIICKDKANLDKEYIIKRLNQAIKQNPYIKLVEWPYKNIPHRIIAEELLEVPDKLSLTDYKIYCFNGIPKYIQVIQDRNSKETIDFFDTKWVHQSFVGLNPNCKNADKIPSKPKNISDMLEKAMILAKNIPFIRVDFYNIDGKIFFGELTFYPASGFGKFTPESIDFDFGKLLELPINKATVYQ